MLGEELTESPVRPARLVVQQLGAWWAPESEDNMALFEQFTYYLYAYFVVKYYGTNYHTAANNRKAITAVEGFVQQLVDAVEHAASTLNKSKDPQRYHKRDLPEVCLGSYYDHTEQIHKLYHAELALAEHHFWEIFVLAMHDTYMVKAIYRTPLTAPPAALQQIQQQRRNYLQVLGQNKAYLLGHSELLTSQTPRGQGRASEQWAREFYAQLLQAPHDPLRSEQAYAHLFFLDHQYPWLCFHAPDKLKEVNSFLARIFPALMWCYHKVSSQVHCWQADLGPAQEHYRQQILHARQRLELVEKDHQLEGQTKVQALNNCLIEFSNLYLQYADLVHKIHHILLGVQTNVNSFSRLLDYHELQLQYDQIFTIIAKDLDKYQRHLKLNLAREEFTLEHLQTLLQTFQARMQNARSAINARTNLLIGVFGVLIAVVALIIGLLEVVVNLPAGRQWLQQMLGGG